MKNKFVFILVAILVKAVFSISGADPLRYLKIKGGTMEGVINMSGKLIWLDNDTSMYGNDAGGTGWVMKHNELGTEFTGITMSNGYYSLYSTTPSNVTSGVDKSGNLGSQTVRWDDLYLAGELNNGTDSVTVDEIITMVKECMQ